MSDVIVHITPDPKDRDMWEALKSLHREVQVYRYILLMLLISK